ncbi:hypothetical protein Tco_0577027 [Tanacetum coccineum]
MTRMYSTVSPSVSTTRESFTNADDLPMPDLEDTANLLNTGIFSGAYDDEDMGAEADLNNLETTMNISPFPITRIHKDHPKDQIIRYINSATQTRRIDVSLCSIWKLVNTPYSMQLIWRIDGVSLDYYLLTALNAVSLNVDCIYRRIKSGNGLLVHQVLDTMYASRMIRRIGCQNQ